MDLSLLPVLLDLGGPILAVAAGWGALRQRMIGMDKRMERIEEDLRGIKNNHLMHVQEDMRKIWESVNGIDKEVEVLKTIVKDLRKKN